MKRKEELEKLLVVVDMVNGFIKKGNMADPYINHITPRIIELVEKMISTNEGVVFIKDTHNLISSEFKKFPVHCIKGSTEEELIDELKEYEKYGISYEKNSISTMYANGFIDDINQMKKLKEVIISGCCSDICVLNLAIPLTNYFDQHDKDINVSVVRDAIETYDSPTHNREEYNEITFKLLKQSGINIL